MACPLMTRSTDQALHEPKQQPQNAPTARQQNNTLHRFGLRDISPFSAQSPTNKKPLT
jgi:hypothetical protein